VRGRDNLQLFERRWPYYVLNFIFWTRGIAQPYAGGFKLWPNILDGEPSVFFHEVRCQAVSISFQQDAHQDFRGLPHQKSEVPHIERKLWIKTRSDVQVEPRVPTIAIRINKFVLILLCRVPHFHQREQGTCAAGDLGFCSVVPCFQKHEPECYQTAGQSGYERSDPTPYCLQQHRPMCAEPPKYFRELVHSSPRNQSISEVERQFARSSPPVLPSGLTPPPFWVPAPVSVCG